MATAENTFQPTYPDEETLVSTASLHRWWFQIGKLPRVALDQMYRRCMLLSRLSYLSNVQVLCHDRTYVRSFLSGSIAPEEMRKINLPWSEKLVRRTLVGTGSAITAARMALQAGVACMCNGGTHHAHGAHGSGWCIFNDQAGMFLPCTVLLLAAVPSSPHRHQLPFYSGCVSTLLMCLMGCTITACLLTCPCSSPSTPVSSLSSPLSASSDST